MPNYLREVAVSRKEALEKIEKRIGHKNITILREGEIVDKKRGWFKTIYKKAYFIECAEYLGGNKNKVSPPKTLNNPNNPNNSIGKVLSLNANLSPTPQVVSPTLPGSTDMSTPSNTSSSVSGDNHIQTFIKNISQKINEQTEKQTDLSTQKFSSITNDFNNRQRNQQNAGHVSKSNREGMIDNNVYSFLVSRDFSEKFSQKIVDLFNINILRHSSEYHRLADHVASLMTYSGIVKVKNDQPHYVFVVGPTGVGKTTTLSKIASNFYTDEEHYPRPAMIKFASLDAKRIMAMEQLRKFANILRVPFKSVYGADDFKELYKSNKKKELILIDTSGVSKQDTDLIDEIAVFTRSLKCSKEIHLCLNAQSRLFDLKKTFEVLAKTKPDRVIITKIDESYSLGSILSLLDDIRLPISYITNGQDVPIDIISADKEKIKSILLKEWGL